MVPEAGYSGPAPSVVILTLGLAREDFPCCTSPLTYVLLNELEASAAASIDRRGRALFRPTLTAAHGVLPPGHCQRARCRHSGAPMTGPAVDSEGPAKVGWQGRRGGGTFRQGQDAMMMPAPAGWALASPAALGMAG